MEQWRIIEVYCCINRLQQLFQIMLKEGIYSLLSQQQEPRIINILLLFFEIQQWVIFYVPPWSRHLSHTKFHIHVLPLENSPRTRIRRNILNDENRPFLGCFCFFVKALLKSEFFSLKTSTIDPVAHVQLFKIHELTNLSIPNLYLRSLKLQGFYRRKNKTTKCWEIAFKCQHLVKKTLVMFRMAVLTSLHKV